MRSKHTWKCDAARYDFYMSALRLDTVLLGRQEEMKDLADFDLVLSSYEALCAEGVFFKKRFLWRLVVIVDEGQGLFLVKKKNDKSQSQLSQKLKQVGPFLFSSCNA